MSLGQENKELKAAVESATARIAELDGENAELKAQIAAVAEADEARIEAAAEIEQARADADKVIKEQLADAQGTFEELRAQIAELEAANAELSDDNDELEEVADAQDEIIKAKDAKMAMPAMQDAEALGESEAADIAEGEPNGVLDQFAAITDPAAKQAFWRQNKAAIQKAQADELAASKE